MSLLPGPYTRAGILLYALPLYAGPLLAGLAAAPLRTLAVFAAGFALVALSGRRLDLSGAPGWAGLALVLVVQLVLVTVLYALGFLVARVTGPAPLPAWLPLLLTLAAAAFAAARYRNAGEMDALLDDTLEALEGRAPAPETAPEAETTADPVDEELEALEDAPATPDAAEAALHRLLALEAPATVYLRLLDGMGEGSAARDLAALILLRDPRVLASLAGDERLGLGLELGLMGPPELQPETARTARALIAADAGPAAFPEPVARRIFARDLPEHAPLLAEIEAHLARKS
jgi:hypothetical protein